MIEIILTYPDYLDKITLFSYYGLPAMKQERVILSFIMVLIGLLVAGALFYFYQSTKNVSPSTTNIVNKNTPTPTPQPKIYLTLNQFTDEQVVNDKTFKINGKANPDATIIVVTENGQQVLQPTSQGAFSTTITLDNGQNVIKIQSILPGGETTMVQRTVTYSTEDF
jgi:hypothetical protein